MAANRGELPPTNAEERVRLLYGAGLVLDVSSVGVIGTLMGVFYTYPDNTVLRPES
jgi:hypothetical protein